jgi:hypothetical protein
LLNSRLTSGKAGAGFAPGPADTILPVNSIMELLSTPRHSAKMNGNYFSSAPEYTATFLHKLNEVTGELEFWKPKV